MTQLNNVQDEQNALKYLMGCKDPELLNRMTPDHFGTNDFQNIYKLIRMHYAEHGAMIGWDTLSAEINRRVRNVEKAQFLIDTLTDIKSRDLAGLSSEHLLKSLEGNRRLRTMVNRTDGLLEHVENRSVEEAEAELRSIYAEVFQDNTQSNFHAADMVEMAGKQIKFEFRKTGIEGIDRRGGLILGGLTIVGAIAKAGKSTLATNFGVYNHDNYDGSTAMFTFEQGAGELRSRILSSRSSIDLGMIMSEMLSPEEALRLRMAEVEHLANYNDNMRDFCNETKAKASDKFWPMFWDHFEPRSNRFYLLDHSPDWDELFVQMELLVTTKNVKMIIIDYPFLITRGRQDQSMSSWEYNLLQSRKLKQFARRHDVFVITPAQYDDESGSLKFVKNAVNDCDLFLALTQEEGDADMQPGGAVTCSFKAYRNFLSIPGEPQLEPFKMMREFNYSRFQYFNF